MLEDKRKKIEVINRGRATGRTTELIRRCAKHDYALIVTPSKNRARSVFEQARSQGIYIPFPITFKEFCRGEFCGRNVNAFYFDDLDDSLKEMAMWVPIEAVVIEGDKTNTEDLISREAAINEITEYGDGRILYMSVGDLKYRLEQLPPAQAERIDDEEKKKRLLAEELRARKIMIEDFEGIIHDVIPEVDVYDAIEEVLGWRI